MKRPAFQFYPGDWQRDAALRACSVGARGLWLEMICIMHQAEPYGYLILNGKDILPPILVRIVGASLPEIEGWTAELEEHGVLSRDENGRIFSRRMVRDEEIRQKRSAGGHLSLKNPHVPQPKKDTHEGYPSTPSFDGSLRGSPSSSSSYSVNIPPITPQGGAVVPIKPKRKARPAVTLKTFLEGKKKTGEKPIPETDPVFDYAEKAGISIDWLHLCWREFIDRNKDGQKRYKDWAKAFGNCVRGNWYKLWYLDRQTGQLSLSSNGSVAEKVHAAR